MPPSKKETALEGRAVDGARLYSPSAARNRYPIREVFLRYLPNPGTVLEIGSGTGEHAVFLASASAGLAWFASDPDAAARASIAAHIAASGLSNIKGPHAIDVCEPGWAESLDGPFDVTVSINMIHIAPWAATGALVTGAARRLPRGGVLYLYGPYRRADRGRPMLQRARLPGTSLQSAPL